MNPVLPRATQCSALAMILGASACATLAVAEYDYRIPEQLADGIETADVTSVGGDRAQAERLVGQFLAGSWGDQHSLLIMKDGKLVVEEYFDGWAANRTHEIQSVSKSITALLVGYAIGTDQIGSVDDPIADYLPDYAEFLRDGKEAITIEHLLTMSSGLEWDESNPPYSDPTNVRVQELNSADGVAFVLDRRLAQTPGERWMYNGGGVTLLGEIVAQATGLAASDLIAMAMQGLLVDGDITPNYQGDGRLNTAGGFGMLPRAMLKVGSAVLANGVWVGQQVFDPQWIQAMTTSHISTSNGREYGYLWYIDEYRAGGSDVRVIFGTGYGGQELVLVPALDLVAVMTAANFENRPSRKRLMEEELLPIFVR